VRAKRYSRGNGPSELLILGAASTHPSIPRPEQVKLDRQNWNPAHALEIC
jgi:hypothetical protein